MVTLQCLLCVVFEVILKPQPARVLLFAPPCCLSVCVFVTASSSLLWFYSMQVSFGVVEARVLPRGVGGSGVPGGGGWALSFDHTAVTTPPAPGSPIQHLALGSVDDFEAARAAEIEERLKGLSKRERKLATGETRQFSHRANVSARASPLLKSHRCWEWLLLSALFPSHCEGRTGNSRLSPFLFLGIACH